MTVDLHLRQFQVKPSTLTRGPRSRGPSRRPAARRRAVCGSTGSRSIDDPHEFVLAEAFRDADAGAAHVRSEHFATATSELLAYLASTPKIVNVDVEGTHWSELGEMAVRSS